MYTRMSTSFSSFDGAAQRATRKLERRSVDARERCDLARWEGEGGAVRSRNGVFQPARAHLSMRSAMSRRPSYDSPVRAEIEASAAARVKSAAELTEAKAGPRKMLHVPQNTATRRMTHRRGIRSR
jgi:hypothetical protein